MREYIRMLCYNEYHVVLHIILSHSLITISKLKLLYRYIGYLLVPAFIY